MDFVSDQFNNGRRFRVLAMMDVFTRECLAIEPGQSLKSEDVVRVLKEIEKVRGYPKRINCDKGSEFSGQLLGLWAYTDQVVLEFS